jgi:nitrogen regulatory protein P-II 1
MKDIKAYVHRSRIADVIEAIKTASAQAGLHNLTVYAVQGSLPPLDDAERHYSIDLGQEVIEEFKLELHCEDGDVAALTDAIRAAARTGQKRAGWIVVVDIVSAQVIR